MAEQRRFAAFISYSHGDKAFAQWLHRALESYEPPKGVLEATADRKRTAPVFRDAEELAASADLSAELKDALDRSDALVVVCSPSARVSKWVAQEIEYFRSIGKGDRIFPIIAAGEPNAADSELECLPELLRASAGFAEAFAADARSAAQRREALLKVVAGLLRVPPGRLADRDAHRRRQRRLQIAVGAGVAATIAGMLSMAWIGAAQRAAFEGRARLTGEMRQAFDVEDAPRGVAALAALWPDLRGDEKAAYQRPLAAWLARFRPLDETLGDVPDGAVFASGARLYHRLGDRVAALPFDDTHVVVPAGGAYLAINGAGRLWRAEQGSAGATDITPQNARVWANYAWSSGASLKSGVLALAGRLQSSSAGGATPALLLVDPAGGGWRLIEQGYLEGAALTVDPECAVLSLNGRQNDDVLIAGDGAPQGLSLTTAATAPAANGAVIDFGDAEVALDGLAEKCGAGPVQSSDRETRRSLSLPTSASDAPNWVSDGAGWPEGDPAVLNGYYALGQDVQRANFELPPSRAAKANADLEFDADAVRAEIAGMFNGFDMAAPAAGNSGFTGVFWAAVGVQYGARYVCAASAQAGRTRCLDVIYHGDYGAVRMLGDYVYIQNMAWVGRPMFHLIRRADLAELSMNAPEVRGMPGAAAGAVSLSPSGKEIVLAVQDRFWRFAIEGDALRYVGKLDVPGLAGAGSSDGFEGESATLAHIDETRVVAARADGLVFATDLTNGAELWRARIRPTPANREQAAHRIAVSNGALAIAAQTFVSVLDANTGLMLSPTADVFNFDRAPPEPQAPAEAVDQSCPESQRREACMSARDLAIATLATEQASRTTLAVNGEGFSLLTSEGLVTLAPAFAEGGAPDFASAACRTGWRVRDRRLERFDPLAALKPGASASIADLARCRS